MKNQKGITLIALVITIIVLLILAGVTIAMLTGTDSAPVKANEAKQKQDIGAAKDQVMLYAQEFQTMAYEKIYVRGEGENSTAQTASSTAKTAEIGNLVGAGIATTNSQATADIKSVFSNSVETSLVKGLSGQKVGLATITTGTTVASISAETGTGAPESTTTGATASAWIKIDTTDFVTYGYIQKAGGALVWETNIKAKPEA